MASPDQFFQGLNEAPLQPTRYIPKPDESPAAQFFQFDHVDQINQALREGDFRGAIQPDPTDPTGKRGVLDIMGGRHEIDTTALGRILHVGGREISESAQALDLGLGPKTEEWLRQNFNIFSGPLEPINRALVEAPVVALDGSIAVYNGIMAAAGQTLMEFGVSRQKSREAVAEMDLLMQIAGIKTAKTPGGLGTASFLMRSRSIARRALEQAEREKGLRAAGIGS